MRYAIASYQLMLSTGLSGNPAVLLGLQPMSAVYSPSVISFAPIRKLRVSVTSCWSSSLPRPASLSGDPILNVCPADMISTRPSVDDDESGEPSASMGELEPNGPVSVPGSGSKPARPHAQQAS